MIKYWIWLSTCLDFGSSHLVPLLEKYKTPLDVYKAPIDEVRSLHILNLNELKRFSNKRLDKSLNIIKECDNSQIRILPFDDVRYPKCLKAISNPPACLYVKGKLLDFSNQPIICVIGTRKITDYGRKCAWSLAARLSAGGMLVLSGGALGGDAAAHEGALAVGAQTIAVLPCGINYNYLKNNEFLRKVIVDNGCLISELPPSTPLYKNAFHLRNRLLSALSLGVVIVEADEKSGTLITANHALDQGRDVFVITSRPNDKNQGGTKMLLRDGAKPVTEADDIFREYCSIFPNIIDVEKARTIDLAKLYRAFNSPIVFDNEQNIIDQDSCEFNTNKKNKKNIDETLPKSVQIVYNHIDKDLFTVDDLLNCGVSFEEILSAVTQLELYGYIKAIPGGRYSIIQ